MVMPIKKGSDKESIEAILEKLSSMRKSAEGFEAEKFCGVITLKESPIDVQKRLRSE